MTEFSHINIDLDKTCRIFERRGSDYEDPVFVARGKKIFGWACAIKWENAIQGAKRAGKNLDDYLTAQIAARMGDFAGRKTPVLVWYANNRGLIFLFSTSRSKGSYKNGPDLSVERGFDHTTSQHLYRNAEPFMYWADGQIWRVYLHNSGVESDGNLLFDFGALFPLRAGSTDEWRYNQIVQSPLDDGNIDYGIAEERRFLAEWKGKKIPVERAFCSLYYRGVALGSGGGQE